MAIVVECPHCGRQSGAKEEWVGRSVRCPGCGQAVLIADPAAPPLPVRPPLEARPVPGRSAAAQPARARPAQGSRPSQTPASALPAGRQGAESGGILDLLDAASIPPTTGAPPGGNPPGVPSSRHRRKKSSKRSLPVLLGLLAGGGLLVLCCGIGTALLSPSARDAIRETAILYKAREAAERGGAIPVFLAPPPGATLAAPAAPTGPVWSPAPQLARQLTTNATFDRYSLQLPAGFVVAAPPFSTELLGVKAQDWFWRSQPDANGHRRVFSAEVLQFTITPQRFVGDLEAALNQCISWKQRGGAVTGLQAAPGERGQLDGKQFMRARFSGFMHALPVRGCVFVCMDGDRMVTLEMFCFDAPGAAAYEELEAAALTFRQLQAGR